MHGRQTSMLHQQGVSGLPEEIILDRKTALEKVADASEQLGSLATMAAAQKPGPHLLIPEVTAAHQAYFDSLVALLAVADEIRAQE